MKIPLIIGVIFILVGIGILLFAKRRKWNGLIPLILGSGLFYVFMWGPMSNADDKLQQVLSIQPNTIKEIQVHPLSGEYEDLALVNRAVIIKDSSVVARLGTALQKGTVLKSPGNSQPDWACLIAIVKRDKTGVSFTLLKRSNAYIIKVHSGGDQG